MSTNENVPPWVSGSHDSIALRVSDHPVVKKLCEAFGGAIVSTSANPVKRKSAKTQLEIYRYFSEQINRKELFIVPGSLGDNGSPSLIKSLATGEIVRP